MSSNIKVRVFNTDGSSVTRSVNPGAVNVPMDTKMSEERRNELTVVIEEAKRVVFETQRFAALTAEAAKEDEQNRIAQSVKLEPPQLAPLVPLVPVSPVVPLAPVAPVALVAPVAPVAPVALVAPVTPVALVAPSVRAAANQPLDDKYTTSIFTGLKKWFSK